jgi:hypothetical protein
MTTKIISEFIDLAKRYSFYGQKRNFMTGFTILSIEGTNMEVKVYFADHTKKTWSVYFSIVDNYQKTIEVAEYSKTMSFGYLLTSKEIKLMVSAITLEIEKLELNEVILDEENEEIKSKINELKGQLDDLRKQLKS